MWKVINSKQLNAHICSALTFAQSCIANPSPSFVPPTVDYTEAKNLAAAILWYFLVFLLPYCLDAVGWAEGGHPVCKKTEWWGAGMVTCLKRGADLHMPSWCYCQSLSLASVKSRLVLPFGYWLTWVVPDKGPLNVSVCVLLTYIRVNLPWYAEGQTTARIIQQQPDSQVQHVAEPHAAEHRCLCTTSYWFRSLTALKLL